MVSRKVRLQIGAFVLIALLGVAYVGGRYAGLDRLFGPRGYTVTVDLANSGGIFTNGEVTYRGVTIGRVGQLRLTDNGIQVDLDIDPSAPQISSDVQAVVADRSAVGEQYVDLRPNRSGGSSLKNGDHIAQANTQTPLPVESLLSSVDQLASSVPLGSLRTVVDELNTAFAGSGPQLQALLDSSTTLTNDAMNHLPQTTQLLRDGATVLNTQNQQASAITSFSRDLRAVAAQLKKSDGDLRRVITTAPQLSDQVIGLLRETGPNLGVVVANLLTTTNIAVARKAGIEQLLVTYPLSVAAGLTTVVPGDGTAHFGLALNVFDPPPCTKGYEGTQRRAGTDNGVAPVNNQAYCAQPPGSSIDVRGAQNNPYTGKATQSAVSPGAVGKSPANLAQLLGLPG